MRNNLSFSPGTEYISITRAVLSKPLIMIYSFSLMRINDKYGEMI